MECKHISPDMFFRGIFPSFCQIPTTCLINCPRTRRNQFTRIRLFLPRTHSCAAALATEPSNSSTVYEFNETKRPEFEPARSKDRNVERSLNLDKVRDNGIVRSRRKGPKWYSEKLKALAKNQSLNEGKAIHGELIKGGSALDSHLWVSLINFYAKCGELSFAHKMLDHMPERDVVSWTALISGFVAEGYGSDGMALFCEMKSEGTRPNEFTLCTVLKGCSMSSDLESGKQLHAEVVKVGAFVDVYVGSVLVDLYAKCGEMEYARSVIFFMPDQNDVSWNALLNGYVQVGDAREVLRLFCLMIRSDAGFSNYTLSTVLKACASLGNLRAGQVLHSLAIKIGSELDDYVSCNLVDMYFGCGHSDDALKVFGRVEDPDIVAWSAMISGLDQQGEKQRAVQLFNAMRHSGIEPNEFTLASLVSSATDLGDQHYCKSVHACIYKFGFESEDLIKNALVAMYMSFGLVYDGHQVFGAMSNRDTISWNALLSGYHGDNISNEGPIIFKQMLMEGFEPNIYTFVSILRSSSSLSDVEFGKQVHTHVVKGNCSSDCYVGTALVDMYAKCRCLEDAEVIFDRLTQKDLFTWTVMIAGYAQTDEGEKAFRCFNQMQREGIKFNEFSLASCLRGCSAMANLGNGQQLHSVAIKLGQLGDIFVATGLVDMYGKCGCIDDAEFLFRSMASSDPVLWNTIICAYSKHGQGEKALQAFRTMLDIGVQPDGFTFIGILSACGHIGRIEEGRKLFHLMNEKYRVTPWVEHYACMVDILGRAGKFDEMENFIEQMKLPPNALIWQNVLAASRVHKNVELGEKAAKILFELEPGEDSNYILLSNLYAARGRWDDVSKVRKLMTTRGIKKEPGCSWVLVDSRIHPFLSQDTSHPRLKEIHQKLEELTQKLLSAGYTPDTDHVLHNVTDREKEENLFYHSERIALAFAILSKSTNPKISIFKNLRICEDCHEFMKIASRTINREIVLRDIHRFHKFCNGTCSCKDYW